MAEVEEGVSTSTASQGADEAADSPDAFQVGEPVVIREDFHSRYFQGRRGTIAGPARKGGVSYLLWPVKLDVPPYEIVIMGKYLRRPATAKK